MQQPLEESEALVRYFTQPNDLIVDGCAGAFTTALAAQISGADLLGATLTRRAFRRGRHAWRDCRPKNGREQTKIVIKLYREQQMLPFRQVAVLGREGFEQELPVDWAKDELGGTCANED